MLAFNLLAEDGLEFPTLLTVSTCLSKCWDYSHLPPHPVYMMLETEPWTPQALYQLSHSHRALISCLWVIFFYWGWGQVGITRFHCVTQVDLELSVAEEA